MFKAYVKMASGFCWLVGMYDTAEAAQDAIDTFVPTLIPGLAVCTFIVPN